MAEILLPAVQKLRDQARKQQEFEHLKQHPVLAAAYGWSRPGQEGIDNMFESLKIFAGKDPLLYANQPVQKKDTLLDVLKRAGGAYASGAASFKDQVAALDEMMSKNFGRAWDLLTYPAHFFTALSKLVPTAPARSEPIRPGTEVDPGMLQFPQAGSA